MAGVRTTPRRPMEASKMASSKKKAPGNAKQDAQLKEVGRYYSGKGSGSADTQAARGAVRRSGTLQVFGSESKKRGAPVKKAAAPKATPAGRRAANTKGQAGGTRSATPAGRRAANKRGGSTLKTAATAAGAATAAAAAAYSAGRVGGVVAGRAAFVPGTVHSADGGPVFRLDERTVGSANVRSSNRGAMGQSLGGWGRSGVKQNPNRLWR